MKRLYVLSFMDGSNPTHKLQLSIILYGKAIKEKGNSERSLFNQELNPMEPILLTELNWFPRLSGGSLEGQTRGGISVGTLWPGGPVLLGIYLSPSQVWVDQRRQSGCLWVSRQRELLERQREALLELSSYEYVVHGA